MIPSGRTAEAGPAAALSAQAAGGPPKGCRPAPGRRQSTAGAAAPREAADSTQPNCPAADQRHGCGMDHWGLRRQKDPLGPQRAKDPMGPPDSRAAESRRRLRQELR